MLEFLKNTFFHVFTLFGFLFAVVYLLSHIQTKIHSCYTRSAGWRGILWTAWIGTPVHELSHLLVAKLFRHKILRVSFFRPDSRTGTLGHVEHTFNPASLYQRIGNFFISIAPVFGGSLVLFLLSTYLMPGSSQMTAEFLAVDLSAPGDAIGKLPGIFERYALSGHLRNWLFWLFLYLSFAVSAHIAPSAEDRRHMWGGFCALVVFLAIMNAILFLLRLDPAGAIFSIHRFLAAVSIVCTYALVVSTIHYIAVSLMLGPWKR